MKQGTAYAKRIRQLHHELLKQHGKPPPVDPGDPIEQLLIAILATDCTDSKAVAAYTKLRQQMVDLNEMRVTPAIELAEMFASSLPDAEDKARRIVSVLNDIRRRQDTLDLSFLAQRSRREARDYLESLVGADRFAAARVVLLCLGGHAIPVDNLTLYVLRKEKLVNPTADLAEVQSFLERNVAAADAVEFVMLLGRFVSLHGSRIPVKKLPELLALSSPARKPAPQSKAESAKAKPESPKPAPKADASKAKPPVKVEAAKTKRQPVQRDKATKSGRAEEDAGPAKKK